MHFSSSQGQAILLTALALVLDLLNGFHGSSNIVATMIASRAMSVRRALFFASLAVFAAPFVFGTAVAETFGRGILDPGLVDGKIVIAALVGAIVLDLTTWYFGIPASSSHALLGGIMGAVLMAVGPDALKMSGLVKAGLALFLSPFLGIVVGFTLTKFIMFLCQSASPRVNNVFRRLQIFTALGLGLSYGANDAQKGMGIIALSLLATGLQDSFVVPTWAILACATAIALGTLIGGKRIAKTVGSKIYRVRPLHGFASQAASAAIILGAAAFGGPVSTTQVVSSTVMGVGSAERISRVRWGVVGQIITTWLITIPLAAILSALAYRVIVRA